jgi:hypothetical protein
MFSPRVFDGNCSTSLLPKRIVGGGRPGSGFQRIKSLLGTLVAHRIIRRTPGMSWDVFMDVTLWLCQNSY